MGNQEAQLFKTDIRVFWFKKKPNVKFCICHHVDFPYHSAVIQRTHWESLIRSEWSIVLPVTWNWYKIEFKNWTWNNRLIPSWERNTPVQYTVTLLIELICRVHHAKCWAGEAQAGIQIAGRNVNNLRYVDDTTLMAESEEELKSLLMKVKERRVKKLA